MSICELKPVFKVLICIKHFPHCVATICWRVFVSQQKQIGRIVFSQIRFNQREKYFYVSCSLSL